MSVGSSVPHMGYQSALGVAKETVFGTFVTSTAHVEFNTEAFKQSREEIKYESINTTRDYKKRFQGLETIEGSLEANLNPASDAMVNIMKQAMGGSVTSSQIVVGVEYLHTLYPGDMESNASAGGDDMKGLSIAVRRGSVNVWNYAGCRVNNLTIKGELGAPVMVSAEMIGRYCSISSTIPTVSLSDVLPVNFIGVEIQTGDTIANTSIEYFTNFEFSLVNNLDGEQRSLGGRNVVQLPAVRRDLSLKLTQRFDTTTAYDRFLANTQVAINIICDSNQSIGAAATTYATVIKLPKCYINSNQPEVGGAEVLTHELEVTPIYDSEQTYSCLITMRNGTATYV